MTTKRGLLPHPKTAAVQKRANWTYGHYRLFRWVFGLYLLIHFAQLLPHVVELFSNIGMLPQGGHSPFIGVFPNILQWSDSPHMVLSLTVVAIGASFLFSAGVFDRIAAVVIWYVLACFFGRNPLIANSGLPFVGWLLIAHALLPSKRGWYMPRGIYWASWIVLAVGYSYSGIVKLASPAWIDGSALEMVLHNSLARSNWLHTFVVSLPQPVLKGVTWSILAVEIGFAPLAMFRRLRPWLWLATFLMQLVLIGLVDCTELTLGMVMIHLFTVNPGWIRSQPAHHRETVFYDGKCGLCHRFVQFVLQEECDAPSFSFAPLSGDLFRQMLTPLPLCVTDSIVVITEREQILTESRAIAHILRRLGGLWRVVALLLDLLPTSWLNRGYWVAAQLRHRLTKPPTSAFPILPPHLRSRFFV